ncbi:MAG: GNAT family N-acetyltransferase [Actinomycetota bacterium]
MLPPGHTIEPMRPEEIATLMEWAAAEGWNPGSGDAEVAAAFDPEAFVALRAGGELVGGGSILAYGAEYGFMGLFIVRADRRHGGLGRALWHFRRDRLTARLRPDAPIGMDGVLDLVPFYERGGFTVAHRDLRFEGIAVGSPDPAVAPLTPADASDLVVYDARHAVTQREDFLAGWIARPGVVAGLIRERGDLVAFGVLRPGRVGWKVGPLTADRPDLAERLLGGLLAAVEGEQVQIDVPEPNVAALDLVARLGLREVFGCARMYRGPAPELPLGRIYGMTSLEFG